MQKSPFYSNPHSVFKIQRSYLTNFLILFFSILFSTLPEFSHLNKKKSSHQNNSSFHTILKTQWEVLMSTKLLHQTHFRGEEEHKNNCTVYLEPFHAILKNLTFYELLEPHHWGKKKLRIWWKVGDSVFKRSNWDLTTGNSEIWISGQGVQMKKQDREQWLWEETNVAIHVHLRKLNLTSMEEDIMGG